MSQKLRDSDPWRYYIYSTLFVFCMLAVSCNTVYAAFNEPSKFTEWLFVLLYGALMWVIFTIVEKSHGLTKPRLPDDTMAYGIIRALFFLMPTAFEEHGLCLIGMRHEWKRENSRVRTEAFTYRYIARWLLNEILYLSVHPFRLIKREIFRP